MSSTSTENTSVLTPVKKIDAEYSRNDRGKTYKADAARLGAISGKTILQIAVNRVAPAIHAPSWGRRRHLLHRRL